MALTIPTSDPNGYSVAEFDTPTLLAHAARQARQRKYQDFFIFDCDAHHYENEHFREIAQFIEDPVLRQQALASGSRSSGAGFLGQGVGNQDMSGRITRYHTRKMEHTPPDKQRDTVLARRWMDAVGIDIAILFPTPLLLLATHPVEQVKIQYIRAYNRWLTESVLPHESRLRTMLCLPFNDPDEAYKIVQEFGDKKGVIGFMVPATFNVPVHDNRLMKVYAAIEERGMPLAFHGAQNWADRSFVTMNRFIGVHALGFVFYNMVHMTNWIVNALPERFPKLKTIWMESGLAWLTFMIQRLDNEYFMRTNECPGLKKKPGDYIRDFYFTCQPMERPEDLSLLQSTFKAIHAETQLLYASDYPHWDFDLPSVIFDLPFVSEQGKRNILGGNAQKLFGLQDIKGKLAQIPSSN